MADYDNQELAGAKRWWQNNAGAAVVGIVIAIVLLGVWYGYDWYQARQSTQAAKLYTEVARGIQTDNVTGGIVNTANRLQSEYDGTPYAAAAAMAMARYYVQQSDFNQAGQRLAWAMDNANDPGIRAIATVRGARSAWAANDTDKALQLLSRDHPASFDALFGELAGDIHRARGERDAARTAYQNALAALPKDVSRQPLMDKARSVGAAEDSLDSFTTDPSSNPS